MLRRVDEGSSPDDGEIHAFGAPSNVDAAGITHADAAIASAGDEALEQGKKDAALTAFQQAMKGARDEDQIKDLAKKLKDLGSPVDLPTHFGFVRSWKLIAPFTNVERKGFDTVFPPEEKIEDRKSVV